MKRKDFLSLIGKGMAAGSIMLGAGCSDFLNKTPASTVTEDDIFSTYESYQGFVDQMYSYLVDYNSHDTPICGLMGDFYISTQTWSNGKQELLGNYAFIGQDIRQSNYRSSDNNWLGDNTSGMFEDGWRGIRAANMALEKMDLLADATEEERQLLRGQALFFRAYFHWEIGRAYGGIPYIDRLFGPSDNMNLPRLNWQDMADRMAADFEKAASLLPIDWDNTTVGSQFKGANTGRVTKGAALSFQAKTLLYAGSPLMNGTSGGSYTFNEDYMKRAADAAWKVIQLADQGVYRLMSIDKELNNGAFTEYNSMFARNDGITAWTDETIWAKTAHADRFGRGVLFGHLGRVFLPGRFAAGGVAHTPTQNLVDLFEMQSTGLPIDDPASGYDPMNPWEGRDPRFRNGILVDGDQWTYQFPAFHEIEMHVGGKDKSNWGVNTPYLIKKFWPKGANRMDGNYNNYTMTTPHMRLAEIYLIYAEAVNEAYGPNGSAPAASMTAIDAINVVRNRANMPDVNLKYTGSTEDFRPRIWNERGVELFFENNRWFDIRRWYVAHKPEYKVLYDLEFDDGHTFFNKVEVGTRVFEQRHYWLPFPTEQTQLYPGFPQNPGW